MSVKQRENQISDIAKAIGNPLRIQILTELIEGSLIVSNLLEKLQVEPTILSKHLSVLRSSGLIDCDVEWRCRRYHLKDTSAVKQILELLDKLLD